LLVALSGAVALVYQSLWMRQLSLILGSTTYAVGTVLAAFMGGLGVGAFVLGRRADRSPSPLRLYALLELAIGLAGLASPVVLAQGNGVYAACYARLAANPPLLTLARFLIGFGFVALPAFLMGGTLPVATRYVVRQAEEVGRGVGLLYAVNTLGAAVGALALPFVLLPALGMRTTLVVCGLTNLLIALAAWRAASAEAPAAPVAASARGQARARGGPLARSRGLLLAAFFLSGLVALALEVVWNRFFVMYIGSSIYSYAVILFLYLVGIAAGGMLFARLDRRGIDPGRAFAVCLLVLVGDLAVTIPLMDRIFYLQLVILDLLGAAFVPFQLASVAAACLIIVPPTILLGVSFPAVAKAVSPDVARVATQLGLAYVVNTAGTTLGALAASFLLIPGLGVRRSLDLLVVLAAAAFALAAGRPAGTGWRRAARTAAPWALALLPVVMPAWDTRLMHTTLSKLPDPVVEAWRQGTIEAWIARLRVRELRDGVDATVAVTDYDDGRALFVNGKPDAGTGDDMPNQMLLGHLPMLVHPSPRDVLVVGMGSGVTLASAARHPAARIDLVEISPEVLSLGDRYFRKVNRRAVHDPRVTVHLEDGRNFIAFNEARSYDVIINEPSNPWVTGVSNLFTDEFFAQVRRRLRPGGVLAQWFHFYTMDLEDVRSLVGTLTRHLPHVYVFAFHHDMDFAGDLIVLAAEGPLDFAPVAAALRGEGRVAKNLRRIGLDDPRQLLQAFVLGPGNVGRFVAGAALNSDDRPRVELNAPRYLFGDTLFSNLRALLEASGGARLPVGGEPAYHAFKLPPPPGFRRTYAGYRIEVAAAAPDAESLPPRNVLREVEFEDDPGRRLAVVSAPGLADPDRLERFALEVAGAPATAADDGAVGGHQAVTFRLHGGGSLHAWVCPRSRASYVATVPVGGANAAGVSSILGAVRCHEDG
jgi:spermidine synthase